MVNISFPWEPSKNPFESNNGIPNVDDVPNIKQKTSADFQFKGHGSNSNSIITPVLFRNQSYQN